MPFKSKKQMRWMFANDPEMAKRWAAHTKDMKNLPEEKEEKKEASVGQEAGAELLDKAANLLANRINKPKVPLPSAINPNRPTANIKPVQQNPLIPASQQYGANSQQAVQQKAQQLGQQQPAPKMAFLRKLAEGPSPDLKNMMDAFAPKKPDTTPTVPTPMPAQPKGLAGQVGNPMAGRIDTNTGNALGQKPQVAAPDFSALPGFVNMKDSLRQQVMSQDNLAMHGINSRLVNPQDASVDQIARFNAIAPVADLSDRNTLKNPNNPLSAEMIQDVINRDAQRFNQFAQEQAYEGAPFSWVDAIKGNTSAADPQQKQLAEAYLQNRIQTTADVDSRQRQVQSITQQQLDAEQKSRDINAFAKRWTGLDEATLNRLAGTVPEELKLRARSGDANALKEIQKLEEHYANRGALGYAGDIAGTGWDMINSNAGMLAGGLAGAGLRTVGRAGTAALTRNMATRANLLNNPATRTWSNLAPRAVAATAQGAAKAPAAIGEMAGGLAQGIGTFNTQVGLGREALTPIVGEDSANTIANLAATSYYGGKGLVYDPAKALLTKGLPGLAAAAPGMIPSGIMAYMGGKDIYKNRDTIANDLNPYATDKDVNLTNFDRLKENNVGPIQDAVVGADAISPNAVLNANQPLSVESFNKLPQGFPSHMAAINSDAILRENPQMAELSAQAAQLNSIADPVARDAARIKLNGQVREQFGSSLDEFEAFNSSSNNLVSANKALSDSFQAMQASAKETDPSKIKAVNKSYTDALTNYEAVSRQATEKAIPFLTKYQDTQYKKVIAPMEQELPSVAQSAQKAMSDRLKGIVTPEGEQAIARAAQMQETANRHSYSNAMLSLMKSGKITKADLDLKMGADPTAAKKMIDGLFQGKAVETTNATEGYKIDPNTLQPVPTSQYKDNSAADVLAADSKRNIATSLNQQSNGGLEQNPGLWSKLTNEVWGKMQPWEKTLTLGGLSLGAIGLFSSLAGGDEDEEDDEDSGGSFMPLLAIAGGAAALASPMARYFGAGNTQAPQQGQQGV
jgi:hypothetical protein